MKRILIIIILFVMPLFAETRYRIKSNVSKTFDSQTANLINDNFDDLDYNKQDMKFKIFASTPTASEMQEGYIVLYSTGIAIKINGEVKLFKPVN